MRVVSVDVSRCVVTLAFLALLVGLPAYSHAGRSAPVAGTRAGGWQAITVLAEKMKAPSSMTAKERADKAYQLAVLIERKAGKSAPRKLVTDLADLMSDDDPTVRFWIAGALGNLGPQAASAIPALEKALEEARAADPPDRGRTGIHLDDVIQQALEKISRRKK